MRMEDLKLLQLRLQSKTVTFIVEGLQVTELHNETPSSEVEEQLQKLLKASFLSQMRTNEVGVNRNRIQ